MRNNISFLTTLLLLLGQFGCAGAPTQPPAPGSAPDSARTSTAGRWSGSFTAQNQAAGGRVRLTVGDDGKVNGSLVDTVWQSQHGVARTGTMAGTLGGGVAQVTVIWSTGQTEQYEGTASAPSHGSLGVNLRLYAPDGNFARSGGIALALHDQGSPASPPYGAPPTTPVNFLAQYQGKWVANFHSIDGNAGTGSVTIDADGNVTGAVVDDEWSDSSVGNPAEHATLAGKVNGDGQLALSWTWKGQPAQYVHGKGYFEAPETLVFQMGPSLEAMVANGPSLTLTLARD